MRIKAIASALIAGCLAVTSMFTLAGCGVKHSNAPASKTEETTEAPTELILPISSEEALKMNHDELYTLFTEAGFKNTDSQALEDLDSSSDKLNEVTKSVTADGQASFQKVDKMMSDCKIVISYHSVKNASLPIDKYDLEKDDDAIYYEDAVTQFQKEGFKDIGTRTVEDSSKPEGSVVDVTVDGKSCASDLMFSAPVDAKIVIVYCTKESPTDSKASSKAESKQESRSNTDSGVVTPSFKETMDSYEAFFDSYIDFMKKYKENPSDLTMLSEYADYMSKYNDYMSKISAIDSDNLSAADLAYYSEVHARIMKKLAETGA